MFQARSKWRHTRLIFDHAEGPLIRFAYSLSWVLCSNYHNCCAKHACLYGWRLDVSVCCDRGILAPNPINAEWMAGPAEGGGYSQEEGEGHGQGCWSNPQPVWHSPGQTQLQHTHLQPPGAFQDSLSTCCNLPPTPNPPAMPPAPADMREIKAAAEKWQLKPTSVYSDSGLVDSHTPDICLNLLPANKQTKSHFQIMLKVCKILNFYFEDNVFFKSVLWVVYKCVSLNLWLRKIPLET